ncbi:hypothetical protein SteCoe_32471 [Stentor coeruleus]|uniref:Uncharacterized protein n=1 Tax=Stentor coeruleus TaxID=5963 RepID=A0A1R2AYX9_9CILI|nr:hypothetical protein SteCoe_32471 [Stentor coeruleus]
MQPLVNSALEQEQSIENQTPRSMCFSSSNSPASKISISLALDVEQSEIMEDFKEIAEEDEKPTEQKKCLSPVPCRICLQISSEELIRPCNCKGTLSFVHQSCLKEWLLRVAESDGEFKKCEICKGKYNVKFNYRLRCDAKKEIWMPLCFLGTLLILVIIFTAWWGMWHEINDPICVAMIALISLIGISLLTITLYVLKFQCIKKSMIDITARDNEDTSFNQGSSRI